MRAITRRDLLTATPPSRHHISSAVVVALPARRQAIVARLAKMRGVEVHADERNRIVVTIEGPTRGMLGATLAAISALEGVISANMVFEYVEEHEESRT